MISVISYSLQISRIIGKYPGGGARAAGMGGAGLALAEGEMAYSWNPGAMIYTDKTKFGIDVLSSANKHSDEISFDVGTITGWAGIVFNGHPQHTHCTDMCRHLMFQSLLSLTYVRCSVLPYTPR